MVATVMCISEDLKKFISSIQENLKKEIQQHNIIFNKLKQDPENGELERRLKQIQHTINGMAEEQQFAVHRIKLEVKLYGKELQSNGLSHAILGRATNLNNAIQLAADKVKKSPGSTGTSPLSPLPSGATTSENVGEEVAVVSESSSDTSLSNSPEPPSSPLELDDLTQVQFLKYFGIVTHAVHEEMQKKRVERKRRSTANPQFFYGTKWDFPIKRKRSTYLASSISPPQTRQAAKNKAKAERAVTPPSKDTPAETPIADAEPSGAVPSTSSPTTTSPINLKELSIPKLPVGLTIERVDPNRTTPDSKLCIVCGLQGSSLYVCESCMNGFHGSCYTRPLKQPPRKCPKCVVDVEVRTVGSLNVSSDMTVSYVSTIDLTEKLHEKQKLLEENKSLTAELIKLQNQHSELTITLKEQQVAEQELLVTQHVTEDKIKHLISFINSMKSPVISHLQ